MREWIDFEEATTCAHRRHEIGQTSAFLSTPGTPPDISRPRIDTDDGLVGSSSARPRRTRRPSRRDRRPLVCNACAISRPVIHFSHDRAVLKKDQRARRGERSSDGPRASAALTITLLLAACGSHAPSRNALESAHRHAPHADVHADADLAQARAAPRRSSRARRTDPDRRPHFRPAAADRGRRPASRGSTAVRGAHQLIARTCSGNSAVSTRRHVPPSRSTAPGIYQLLTA